MGSSRSRNSTRSRGRSPSDSRSSPPKAAPSAPGKPVTLGEIAVRLGGVHAVVLTAVEALRQQAADVDAAVATTLLRAVADPLSIVIEQLEGLAAKRGAQ